MFELQLGSFGCDFAHLLDDVSQLAVVVDPFLVDVRLGLVESAGDGLAVDLGGPLVVGAVGLGWVGVAFAAGRGAARVAGGEAAGVDQADGGELGGDLAIALLVVGEALGDVA